MINPLNWEADVNVIMELKKERLVAKLQNISWKASYSFSLKQTFIDLNK